MLQTIRSYYYRVPIEGRNFLLRALGLFIAWKLLYNFVLVPINIPDPQLTLITGKGAAWFLSLFYNNTTFEGVNFIVVNGVRVAKITPSCNGLELIIMFLGFMACLPTTRKRILSFALIGTAGIIALNVLRLSALSYMMMHHHSLTNFAHHYAFKIIVYAFVFYMWLLYSRKSLYAQ
jgi:exosortase/archaeosortase family protein